MQPAKNRLVIAAAGSGKTTFLIREALEQRDEQILITTYTEANEAEIRKKFIETIGCVPPNVRIQTWFSLLIQHGVKPYQGSILDSEIRGLLLVNQQSAQFVPESQAGRHFLSSNGFIYSDKLAKCVVRCNNLTGGRVVNRLTRIYSCIFIDEVQDLAGYDLDIVKAFFASPAKTLLVGDPRQVVYLTHHEQRHKKYAWGRIREFVAGECKNLGVEIDECTLGHSYRSNLRICQLSDALYPEMGKTGSKQIMSTPHDGVFLIAKSDVPCYLKNFCPIQLRRDRKVAVDATFPVLTFGKSKGLTFERVLIYPTKDMLTWISQRDSQLADQTRAHLYVALTRSKYSVGIVSDRVKNVPDDVLRWP